MIVLTAIGVPIYFSHSVGFRTACLQPMPPGEPGSAVMNRRIAMNASCYPLFSHYFTKVFGFDLFTVVSVISLFLAQFVLIATQCVRCRHRV